MNTRVEELFNDIADLSPEARSRYFAEHDVDEDIRREVEALLAFDSGASSFLLRDISIAASRALPQLEAKGGWRCGPYRLLDLIGRGGMGAVYLAERADGELTQQLAVKLLPAGAGYAHRERFLQERQILAALVHPNIARMLDAGHLDNGQPFLAMEYVDGKPIDVFAAGLSLRQKIGFFLKICAAVGYLHRNLVVHRDLKPSNILVTADGEPKLLDFGIAKILDVTTDSTMTSMRMLTPDYASPEQVTGGRVSTATDIYSLGAVLYRLLTSKPAHEFEDHSAEAVAQVVTAREVTRPSKWSPELKGDLECILLKALRKDPLERYATVEQFAEDLEAFLESRTVRARSGNAWYRTRKFLRRCWVPATAAAIVIASLSVGLYITNRERTLAQRRFEQVRNLANKVLALDDVVRVLPGSTKARGEIVAMSQQYLEELGAEARTDPHLALEIAEAYLVLARAQGLPPAANLGQFAQAAVSLGKADSLLENILKNSPLNRKALLLAAEVARNRMILANTDYRREATLTEARKAAARLDTFLSLGQASEAEMRTAARAFGNIALAHKNLHLYDDSVRYARRSIEIARSSPSTTNDTMGQSLSILADSLRFSGDLEGALQAIREARSAVETAIFAGETSRRTDSFNVLWREGTILGQDGNISLDRPTEAVEALQKAFDLTEEWAQKDPDEAHSRILLGTAARELGLILAHSDPQRALAAYEKGILRAREVQNNTDARRDEARLLAYSSYVLRRLHRVGEAKERIDAAFRLLRQTKIYPADRINPEEEANAVLRAWGDHLAEVGQPQGAADVYQELLDKIEAYGSDPKSDLRDATKFSSMYQALAALDRRLGRSGDAAALDARRLDLWRQWDRKLPNNPFVLRQLAAKPAP